MNLNRRLDILEERITGDAAAQRATAAIVASKPPFDWDGYRRLHDAHLATLARPDFETPRNVVRETVRRHWQGQLDACRSFDDVPELDESAVDALTDQIMAMTEHELDSARRACGLTHHAAGRAGKGIS